jgi:hypothetical protein
MEGYRVAESKLYYVVLCDDCFQNPVQSPGLELSYYGRACFNIPPGKECRGNLVIFRLMAKKKQWRPSPKGFDLLFQLTDDSGLQFEYEIYPVCKAEVAHMLSERRKALDQGAFTPRMWRSRVRAKERLIENENGANALML